MSAKLSVKKAPIFDENPFMEASISKIEQNTIQKKRFMQGSKGAEQNMIVNANGEITGHSAFLQYVEVDEERFTKLYLSQFSSFWELTKPAIRVFGYVMENLLPKKDFIYFDMDEAIKYTKYSDTKMLYIGLAKLIELGILARSNNHMKYFINPLMFFNGDRVTFAKTFVKKKKKSNEDLGQQLSLDFSSVPKDFDHN